MLKGTAYMHVMVHDIVQITKARERVSLYNINWDSEVQRTQQCAM